MARTSKLMSMTSARFSGEGRHVSGFWGGSSADIAALMRRAKIGAEEAELPSFQLRRLRWERDGTAGRTPIGVVVCGSAERALVAKATTLLADATPLGCLRIPDRHTSFRGAGAVKAEQHYAWWQKGESHRKSRAQWVPSPCSDPYLPRGRPPIVVDVDPGLRADGNHLVDLLRGDRYLLAALDAHPGADIVLRTQIPLDELKRIANVTGRTAHCPNGFSETFRWSELLSPDRDALPFRVSPETLDSIRASLDNAPPIWRRTADASDWALTATWAVHRADWLGGKYRGFVTDPPYLTCVPNIEHRPGFAENVKYEVTPAVRSSTWRHWIAKD